MWRTSDGRGAPDTGFCDMVFFGRTPVAAAGIPPWLRSGRNVLSVLSWLPPWDGAHTDGIISSGRGWLGAVAARHG